jgi:hypothetical protein
MYEPHATRLTRRAGHAGGQQGTWLQPVRFNGPKPRKPRQVGDCPVHSVSIYIGRRLRAGKKTTTLPTPEINKLVAIASGEY